MCTQRLINVFICWQQFLMNWGKGDLHTNRTCQSPTKETHSESAKGIISPVLASEVEVPHASGGQICFYFKWMSLRSSFWQVNWGSLWRKITTHASSSVAEKGLCFSEAGCQLESNSFISLKWRVHKHKNNERGQFCMHTMIKSLHLNTLLMINGFLWCTISSTLNFPLFQIAWTATIKVQNAVPVVFLLSGLP